jgi:hypothetical protein
MVIDASSASRTHGCSVVCDPLEFRASKSGRTVMRLPAHSSTGALVDESREIGAVHNRSENRPVFVQRAAKISCKSLPRLSRVPRPQRRATR